LLADVAAYTLTYVIFKVRKEVFRVVCRLQKAQQARSRENHIQSRGMQMKTASKVYLSNRIFTMFIL